jgi:hypothetical protein
MASQELPTSREEGESPVLVVSYLGPASSYTHQVKTLATLMTPPFLLGLTDYDLAQATLQCFEADRYDYKPAVTITGTQHTSYTVYVLVTDWPGARCL